MLKVQIFRVGNSLIGTILEQDNVKLWSEFKASNGFEISSRSMPELGDSTLYIRGEDHTQDNIAFVRNFNSYEKATKYLNKLRVAVSEFNQKDTTEQKDIVSEILS